MGVYLLHFEGPNKARAHYLGCTDKDPSARLKQHASGNGGAFTKGLKAKGLVPRLAFWQPSWGYTHEKRAKLLARGNKDWQFRTWCPVCGFTPPPTEVEVLNYKDIVGVRRRVGPSDECRAGSTMLGRKQVGFTGYGVSPKIPGDGESGAALKGPAASLTEFGAPWTVNPLFSGPDSDEPAAFEPEPYPARGLAKPLDLVYE
jgi:predicted GIY-YIG superfamily endonuclease